jgi:putative ABC transport system permease protein
MVYSVAQGTWELGLRMAVGAQPRSVRWMVLREDSLTVLAGVIIGIAGAVLAARLVRTQLFGLESNNTTTFAVSATVLVERALGAAYIPAAQASKVNPIRALRHEMGWTYSFQSPLEVRLSGRENLSKKTNAA